MLKDNQGKKAVYAEIFDKAGLKAMYDDCNELLD